MSREESWEERVIAVPPIHMSFSRHYEVRRGGGSVPAPLLTLYVNDPTFLHPRHQHPPRREHAAAGDVLLQRISSDARDVDDVWVLRFHKHGCECRGDKVRACDVDFVCEMKRSALVALGGTEWGGGVPEFWIAKSSSSTLSRSCWTSWTEKQVNPGCSEDG